MAKGRKTFEVAPIKEYVNKFLEDSEGHRKDERAGMIQLYTQILMDSGNYKGFGYLQKYDSIRDDTRIFFR